MKNDKQNHVVEQNLPQGWAAVKISEVCKLIGGGTPSRKNPKYFGGGIPWIKISDMSNPIIYSSEETISKDGLKKSNARLHPKNTVLLAIYGSIGKVSVLGVAAATNQAICAFFHDKSIINNFYLFWFLKSIRKKLLGAGFGVTQKNISQTTVKKIKILLPPINEQKRIVSKIESIFAQIDTLEKTLNASKSLMTQFRQVVLNQAFEGKLVPQDSSDTFTCLIKNNIGKIDEAKPNVIETNIPENWIITTIGQSVVLSKEKFKPQQTSSRKYIGLEHIESNTGRIINYGSSSEVKSAKNVFKKGDILYGRLRPYLNKVCIPNFEGVCSTDILVLTPYKFLFPMFFSLYLRTMNFVQFSSSMSQGVNLPRVKFSTIANYQLLLPPYNEQKRIVFKIESIFNHIDMVDAHMTTLLEILGTLRQSVLKQAFEGNLVPQDPHDKPIDKLLEKIRGTNNV